MYDGSGNTTRFEYADARMPVAMTKEAATYYLTYNQVGSLRLVADSTGSVVKRIEYDSFGNIINDTDPLFEIPFGFAGGLHDRDTGLVRFGYRDYDLDIGRWTAKDPILFAGGDVDLYGYCLSDPISFIDPNGLRLKYKGGLVPKIRIWLAVTKLTWKSSTARDLVKLLEASSDTISVELTGGENSYNACSNTLTYNPRKEHIYDNSQPWHERPPEVGLAHELIHGWHDISGTLGRTRAAEEDRTVGIGAYSGDRFTENKVRSDHGISLRPQY